MVHDVHITEVLDEHGLGKLVFPLAKLVDYNSHIVTLQPGDRHHRRCRARPANPPATSDGETVEMSIECLGSVRNKTV